MPARKGILAGRGIDVLYGQGGPGSSQTALVEDPAVPEPTGRGAVPERRPDATSGDSLIAGWTTALEWDSEAGGEEMSEDPRSRVQPLAVSRRGDRQAPIPGRDGALLPEWAVPVGEPMAGRAPDGGGLAEDQGGREAGLPLLAITPARGGPDQEVDLAAWMAVEALSSVDEGAIGPGSGVPTTPPSPMYVEAGMQGDEELAPLPPPKEKPEATDPRVREAMMNVRYDDLAPAVEAHVGRLQPADARGAAVDMSAALPGQGQGRSVQAAEILDYIGLRRRHDLWDRTVELYEAAREVLSTDENLAEALNLLADAQGILAKTPERFNEAEHKVEQVAAMIRRRVCLDRWSQTYGWPLLLYEVAWLGALIAAIVFSSLVGSWAAQLMQGAFGLGTELSIMWNTMAWGGVGGVLSGLYSLYWHVSMRRDFHKQYVMWYLVQPLIGWLLGAWVHLVVGGVFPGYGQEIVAGSWAAWSLIPYAIACVLGFRQRWALELLDRVLRWFVRLPGRWRQRRADAQSARDRP